jgi:hypothetical protein
MPPAPPALVLLAPPPPEPLAPLVTALAPPVLGWVVFVPVAEEPPVDPVAVLELPPLPALAVPACPAQLVIPSQSTATTASCAKRM